MNGTRSVLGRSVASSCIVRNASHKQAGIACEQMLHVREPFAKCPRLPYLSISISWANIYANAVTLLAAAIVERQAKASKKESERASIGGLGRGSCVREKCAKCVECRWDVGTKPLRKTNVHTHTHKHGQTALAQHSTVD